MHGDLLKYFLKWLEQCTNSNSKRTKLYVIGEYSLPSNLETSIGVSKSDTPTQIPCPIGQKAIKRKMKGKRDVASSLIVDLFGMEYVIRKKKYYQQKNSTGKGNREHKGVVWNFNEGYIYHV